jgi:hypothetical protein
MKPIFERLKGVRHQLWLAVTKPDRASWIAHFFLVFLGTLIPFALWRAAFSTSSAIVFAFVLSELWLLFMSGREVVDYLKHAALAHPRRETLRDGLGDLVGPVFNHFLWWAALSTLIGG